MMSIGTLTAGVKTPERLFLPVSLDKALAMAANQKRIVFVDICAVWCGACKKLDEDTWSNGKVIDLLKKKTIPIKLDADKEKSIIDKYKIKAYPTLLLLNSDGSILGSMVGYQIPTQFIKIFQGVMADRGPHPRGQK